MAQSPDAQLATMIANLEANTGKSLTQWTALAKKRGHDRHGALVAWLKAEQGLTHGYANLVAHSTLQSDAGSKAAAGDDLVAEMFDGDKAALRPVYNALLKAIMGFGSDIEQAPKKGYLSLRRKVQFATLHPSTRTRFDVGIKLKGIAPKGRLEAAGSWNAMVTHRVRLESADGVDKELIGWLKQAYDGAA
jgi:predicted transport protein